MTISFETSVYVNGAEVPATVEADVDWIGGAVYVNNHNVADDDGNEVAHDETDMIWQITEVAKDSLERAEDEIGYSRLCKARGK